MASSSTAGSISLPVVLTTQTPYPLPSQKFMIPATWRRYQLSQLVNKALSLPKIVPFDFLVRGEILRSSLGEWCAENGAGEEETLEIEYIESVMPPEKMSDFPHEDWVSAVSCKVPGQFFTASYDGTIRSFDYSKKPTSSTPAHAAAITSISLVPSTTTSPDTFILASASHDLTAHITEVTLSGTEKSTSKTLATLHLHTAPLSSIASNATGTHLLTSSWDTLIGYWDTSIPATDEVPEPALTDRDRKKRRRVEENGKAAGKRKAPLQVLKSHTARVSKVVFGSDDTAISCGFDSTVRVWDVENGLCTHTVTAAEKPFLDLITIGDDPASANSVLASSTDRTVTHYDMRVSSSSALPSAASASFLHSATPSCLASGPAGSHQFVSGAYDGVVRVWDVRSTKGAVASFRAWDGTKKVLSVDWDGGVVGVGGEGGFEVWKVGVEESR
ncbi:Ribosome biogenesis protein YTM1 [Hypsizygus marmoreus]|uniref:Ribosome biogenesis protein YTM1 n=1 Tax=Hypsizygus marmoreus TaxID=39966 RepID=A0A369J9L8_HYPMA|nr:Ribosome biogenesis protein YTM1 [Hypsizygus marmoreus]